MKSNSHFLKVRCADCSNEQVIFSRPATHVACQVCGAGLAAATGGEGVVKGEVLARFE